MINLIPNEEKKKTTKDFYVRLFSMSFTMLSLAVLSLSITAFPSYVVSSMEKKSINDKLEVQEEETISLPDQDTLSVVASLKQKLSLIEKSQKDQTSFSQRIINEIVLKKVPNIKITGISYRNDIEKGETINVLGFASSREVLISFRNILKDNPAFTKVDLPISNFIKGSNIAFSLSLIPSQSVATTDPAS